MGDNMLRDENGQDALSVRLADPLVRAQMLRMLDRLDLIEELLTSKNAVLSLQTEGMVERLSERIENAIQLLDQLSNANMVSLVREIERHAPVILTLLNLISELERSGRLSSLMEITQGAKAINDIFNDSLVERVATQLESIADILEKLKAIPIEDLAKALNSLKDSGALEIMPEIAGSVVTLRKLMTDTLLERVMTLLDQGIAYQNSISTALRMIPPKPDRPPGLLGLWSLIKEPEVQKSLYVIINALNAILKEK
ncbi:MAG: DUF1641 domain-containing protein [Leptospirillum sp.]|jgi:uncharacterized protein YjgD (DUF1641 family)